MPTNDLSQIVRRIRAAARAGRYQVLPHALARMGERGISPKQVRAVILTSGLVTRSPDPPVRGVARLEFHVPAERLIVVAELVVDADGDTTAVVTVIRKG